jgi:hypothetical protein
MKPVTLKQPAVGHANPYEARPPKSGNLIGGEVYDSKAASNQSRLGLVGQHDKLGVLHLEYSVTSYRDFETSAVGEVFARWNPLISSDDGTISPAPTFSFITFHRTRRACAHTKVHNPVKKTLVARGCHRQGQHHQLLSQAFSPSPIEVLYTLALVST